MKRVIIIVMDSVGIGELPDAEKYGDKGSDTLGNISAAVKGFRLPNLQKLGLGNIDGVQGVGKYPEPSSCYGRMSEKSPGKDTTTGHWEIAGIILDRPFPVYPNGFPEDIIKKFEKAIGTKILGNYTASGTEIIEQLGSQHVKTGYPIVYTSADSVFQIAAHESVIPIERQYEICRIARGIMSGKHAVGRIIARPFTGDEGHYVRTERRHDFSLEPISTTILDNTAEKGLAVKAVRKIEDIFVGRGITQSVHTTNNSEGVNRTIEFIQQEFTGMIFTNLVDFDMIYGHRNNPQGYAEALMNFDSRIPEIINALKTDDILMITADHGCDPTTESTDHSREYVPLLVYGRNLKRGVNLGTRSTFSDIAATVSEYLSVKSTGNGISFLEMIS